MLAVICVEVGNYLGRRAQYLRAIARGMRDHLSVPHRLYCISDADCSAWGYETLPANEMLHGWYQKMSLFRLYAVPEKRILYVDLDCIITGDLDGLARYDGRLAVSPDFFRPKYKDSSVMLIQRGACADLWERYCALGMPQNLWRGDAHMLESAPYAENINELFPGAIASFKLGALDSPPVDARIVSFHGEPKPHAIRDGWAASEWARLTQPLEEVHRAAA